MPRWRYFNLGWLMDKQQKVLAIVPARAGSKGVVDKNIRMLHGKPLLAWTIEAALNVRLRHPLKTPIWNRNRHSD